MFFSAIVALGVAVATVASIDTVTTGDFTISGTCAVGITLKGTGAVLITGGDTINLSSINFSLVNISSSCF